MKERPILFNRAMVRAILAGRKTQTRRAIKLPHNNPLGQWEASTSGGHGARDSKGEPVPEHACIWHTRTGDTLSFGQPGDRLWVRETWRPKIIHSCAMDTCDCDDVGVTYAADGMWIPHTWDKPVPDEWCMPESAARGNVPSIHMPRWACRLVLEITDVRVERLQEISDADALAEGAMEWAAEQDTPIRDLPCGDERIAFKALWESTGGDWGSNPWVWVIEFRRIEA